MYICIARDINVCDNIIIMDKYVKTTVIQNVFRIVLAIFMMYAGFSHLTFNRVYFQAQVPDWLPMSKDLVVILSGIVEIILEKRKINYPWMTHS